MARANKNRLANKKKGPSNKRPKGWRGTVAERSQQFMAGQYRPSVGHPMRRQQHH